MFDQLHFTGTINAGAIVNSLITLIGVIVVYFRLKIELMRSETRNKEKLDSQTARIEDCIHKLPGHPENADNKGQTTP